MAVSHQPSHNISVTKKYDCSSYRHISPLRRLLNILHSTHPVQLAELILSLDTEKAFDRIEYYVHEVLKQFGFGVTFCKWIRILYDSHRAAVNTNSLTSDYFQIYLYMGTQQGCCLLPFLFDLAMEPHAFEIRKEETIWGITKGDTIHSFAVRQGLAPLYC